jgi:hypothetical protein
LLATAHLYGSRFSHNLLGFRQKRRSAMLARWMLPRGCPTQDEVNTIVSRATDQLLLAMPRVSWVPLPDGADSLDLPDADGFVCVGWIVASGDHHVADREVWWHPQRQDGRLRLVR